MEVYGGKRDVGGGGEMETLQEFGELVYVAGGGPGFCPRDAVNNGQEL